jgi:hypothetical protein
VVRTRILRLKEGDRNFQIGDIGPEIPQPWLPVSENICGADQETSAVAG